MALFSYFINSRAVDYTLTAVTVATLSILLGIYVFQNRLIYLPQFPPGSKKEVWKPSRFGFHNYEDVYLTSTDGVKLHAYWIPAHKVSTKKAPTILFFHANAGNVGHRLPILRRLIDFVDCNILALSYRGYGHSEGVPEEKGIKLDAQAALDHLLSRGDIDIRRIIVYGQSIGGAVSIDIAARNEGKIAGIVVENTFLSIPRLIPHVMPMIGWASRLCHQKWMSEDRLREIMAGDAIPKILFLSGKKDELVPPSHMAGLYDIATSSKKGKAAATIAYFENGTHNDTCIQPGYFETIAKFIKEKF